MLSAISVIILLIGCVIGIYYITFDIKDLIRIQKEEEEKNERENCNN